MAIFDSIKGVTNTIKKASNVVETVKSLKDPGNARRAVSGLLFGGGSSGDKAAPEIKFQTAEGSTPGSPEDDWRVRISLSDTAGIFYKQAGSTSTQNNLMQPLMETNGVIFPYTPTISITYQAMYNSQQLTHSNYAAQFYQGSEVNDITITGDFTVQTAEEGQYLLAAIYFFRAATKMFFGQGANVGNPPPMVYLDGYGSHYFPHVPCVISGFTHNLPNDVDYINVPVTSTTLIETEVAAAGPNSGPSLYETGNGYELTTNPYAVSPNWGSKKAEINTANNTYKQTSYGTETSYTRLPTTSSISVTLKPTYSRKSLHDKFNLEDFAAGRLLKGNGGFL